MKKKLNYKEFNLKIEKSLKNVFPKAKIPKNFNNLKIGDYKEWDSLGNFNLLLEIEKTFNIRFKSEELTKIISVKEIFSYLKKKNI